MLTEQLLLERDILLEIAAGKREAFVSLFNHYHAYVFAFARQITHSEDLSKELVQDIFFKLWLKRETIAEIENFAAYLNRMVRNAAYNILREMARDSRLKTKLGQKWIEADNSTEMELDYMETLNLLNEALDTLSDQQRLAYQLCHQQGLQYTEAAEQMNISTETVRDYMKKALQKIRQHFNNNRASYQVLITFLFKVG